MDIAVHVLIEGRVQGVWFRSWTVEQAERLGLKGWVRNRRDGSVEAMFAGAEPTVRAMVKRCWDGPPLARVERVIEGPARNGVPASFEQRPTL